MPYPNEHSCRHEDPGKFDPDSFRRVSRTIKGKPVGMIFGHLKGASSTTLQAVRFPTSDWTAAEAKAACTGTFEAAAGKAGDRLGPMLFLDVTRPAFRQEVDGAGWNLVVPEGEWQHPQYGKVQFSRAKLDAMLRNFSERVIQVDPAIDYDHEAVTGSSTRAAGWIEELRYLTDPTPGLWARVNWTPAAKQAIQDGEYRYISPEWRDEWTDNQGRKFVDILFGAALTNRPFLRMEMARHPLMAAAEGMYIGGQGTGDGGRDDEDVSRGATDLRDGREDDDMTAEEKAKAEAEAAKKAAVGAEAAKAGTDPKAEASKALAEVQAQLAAERTAREADAKRLAELQLRLDREEVTKALSEPIEMGGRKHIIAPAHISRFVELALGLENETPRFFSDATKASTAGATPDRTQRAQLIAAVRDLGKALVELGERGFSGPGETGATAADRILAAAGEKIKAAGVNDQGKPKLTQAAAQSLVLAEQPELAREYEREMRERAKNAK